MKALLTAFRLSLPVLGAYWFLGITYGLLAANMGYSICVPVSMALLVYSGSVEFIGLTLLLSTFHPLATFVMAFMVGARHLFYGITMLDRYRGAGWKKPFLIFWMSDETFAVNFANEGKIRQSGNVFVGYLWVSALNYFYWVTGSIIGYLLGRSLGERLLSHLEGLDFVVTAMFVAIFMDDYVRHGGHASLFMVRNYCCCNMFIFIRSSAVYHSKYVLHSCSIIHQLPKSHSMTTIEKIITIGMMIIAVMTTRFLPFIIFPSKERTPHFIRFIGKYLASAVFGMLVIYCLKDVEVQTTHHIFLQLLGIFVCVVLHLWRKNMLLTIAGGTIFYMILVQNL